MSSDNAAVAWQAGQQLLREARFHDAIGYFVRVTQLAPEAAAAWIQRAQVEQRIGHYRQSHASTLQAAALGVSDPAEALPLARLLRSFEDRQRLQALAQGCGWHAWTSATELLALARQLAILALHDDALAVLDRIDALAPGCVEALYLRGTIDVFDGRPAGALAAFGDCLSAEPAMPQAHWMLSVLEKRSADAGLARELRTLLDGSSGDPARTAYLGYALHNRLHALGAYPEAWDALTTAWAARRARTAYDAHAQERLFARIRETCDTTFVSGMPAHAGRNGGSQVRPIFIVGLHRSGTSLLERMLGGHPAIQEGGESYAFPVSLKLAADYATRPLIDPHLVGLSPGIQYTEVSDRFLALMAWRAHGAPMVTDKLPGNFMLVGHILRALPDAIVLHMVRDPVDTCFSNLRTYFEEAAPYATGIADMVHYHRQYQQLMAHWHAVAPGRVLDVEYASLVSDPESRIGEVLAHCGLAFVPDVVRVDREGGSVRTASMMDVRAGIETTRVQAWMPYRDRLAPLLAAFPASGPAAV